MMRITFKNVDHGDSIIIEWEHDGIKKIGLIDCNLTNSENNPVLDYIATNEAYTEIEFIILSHPHYDHFSGMRQLLEFCTHKSIIIHNFLHTCFTSSPYLEKAVRTHIASNELFLLFTKLRELKRANSIKHIIYITNANAELILTNSIKLKFIAPTENEFDKYREKKPDIHDVENTHNNSFANLLSTILMIYSNNWTVLLTSDSEKDALANFGITDLNEYFLGQVPHHGSKNNHFPDFWDKLKNKDQSRVVFSCGKNIYNHPSKEVVDFFTQRKFHIEYTNKVGGLLDEVEDKTAELLLNLSSSFISSSPSEYNFSRDLVYTFD